MSVFNKEDVPDVPDEEFEKYQPGEAPPDSVEHARLIYVPQVWSNDRPISSDDVTVFDVPLSEVEMPDGTLPTTHSEQLDSAVREASTPDNVTAHLQTKQPFEIRVKGLY
jgi:hypothetical protein